MIVARTKKGKGVKAVEDQPGKHGKPLEDPEGAIEELGGERNLMVDVAKPDDGGRDPHTFDVPGGELPTWELGEEVATREAYGKALTALGSIHGDVVALDGEVSNSTHSEIFREAHPERYFEMFIAEQQMVAAAVGMQVRGWKPFASTFAAFLSRAYDFVRMAAISRANLRLSGSHAGVSIGEDGPSQMALEDIAAFRAIHGSTRAAPVRRQPDRPASWPRWPSAATSPTCARCAAKTDGAHAGGREGPDRRQPRRARRRRRRDRGLRHHRRPGGGGGRAARGAMASRPRDRLLLDQADRPETLAAAARECGAIVTVEDHWPEGGLGDAVLDALAERRRPPPVIKLAVRDMPASGTPDELLHAAGIDAEAIVDAAHRLVGTPTPV